MTTKFKMSGGYNVKDQVALVPALGKGINWDHI